jgi:membrane associated rhomboid family serine protease
VAVGSILNPSSLTRIGEGQVIAAWLTLFTYVFAHGGWWHVLPNMTALWVFGAIAERVMGTWRFVAGYFLSGAVGAFSYALVVPNSTKPLAGASLAIAGIVGAYAAWRWSSRPHSGSQWLLTFALEVVSVAGVITSLTVRVVPVTPDLQSSIMYHFIPFLAMWLGVRTCYRLQKYRRVSS